MVKNQFMSTVGLKNSELQPFVFLVPLLELAVLIPMKERQDHIQLQHESKK